MFVTSVQLVVVKSVFSCNAKVIEGTSHESRRLPLEEGVMLNTGVGVERPVKIPHREAPTQRLPSADAAREGGLVTGASLANQIAPESNEP